MPKYKIHWVTGETTIIEGETIGSAYNNAGYTRGHLSDVNYYERIKEPVEQTITPTQTMEALKHVDLYFLKIYLSRHLDKWIEETWNKLNGDILHVWCQLDLTEQRHFDEMIMDITNNNIRDLPRGVEWPRIRNLPENEQKPFSEWLKGQTTPYLRDEEPENQDGYFAEDYKKWKNNLPIID